MISVVLRADIAGVGKRGDITNVSDGYARNYLFPRGLAFASTPGAVSQANRMRRSRDLKDAKDREAAETVARALVPKVIKISAKAHEGKLFGSVSAADVIEAVKAQTGIDVDRRKVNLSENIKTTGTHEVPVKLHGDVEFRVTVEVSPA